MTLTTVHVQSWANEQKQITQTVKMFEVRTFTRHAKKNCTSAAMNA